MADQFDFSVFARQSTKGIVVNYFFLLYRLLKAVWPLGILLVTKENISYVNVLIGVAAVLILVLIIAVLQFIFFMFKIDQQHFTLKKGIIQKSNISIPFERIQNISYKQNLVQQVINVVQVEIETAGAKGAEISIKALERNRAEALKTAIMSQVNTTPHEGSLEPDQARHDEVSESKELLKIGFLDLVKVSLTENHLRSLLILISLFFSFGYQFEELSERFELEQQLETIYQDNAELVLGSTMAIVMIVIFLLIVSILVSVVRTFLFHFQLSVNIKNKALEISQGLLTKRNFILKKEKVQYLTVSTNPLKRWLRINNVVFRQASTSSEKNKRNKQIKIVGAQDSQIKTLRELLFDSDQSTGLTSYFPHPFYKTLMYLRSFVLVAVLNGVALLADVTPYLFLSNVLILPVVWGLVNVKFRKNYYKMTNGMLIKGFGQVDTRTTYFEHFKTQNVSIRQSFIQKRRGVVNLILQTSSGKVHLPYIPEERAAALYNYLLFETETSTRKWI